MKRSSTQTSTLFLTLIAAAAMLWSPAARAVPTWAESFGLDGHGPDTQGFYGTGDDTPLGIAAMPDGGVVVVGKLSFPTAATAHTENLTTDALIRYAADGTILWKKALRGDRSNYSTDGALRFARIVSDTQGNIFLASLFHDDLQSGGPDITFAAKFSPNGAVIWQSNLGGSANDAMHPLVSGQFNSLSLAPNGNLVLTCSSAPAGGGLSFPALFVVDAATGSVVFRRQYHNTSAQYLPAQAGCGSLDGTKYLFCTPYNDLSVIVTNAAGDILDAKNYFNFYQRPGATMSIPTADGDFVVLSGNVIRKIGADQVTVGGVTSTVLVTRFERIINYAGMGGHTIVQTADGGYLIGGSISVGGSDLPPNTSGSKAGVYKLNGLGEVTRVFAYGGFAAETQYEASTSAGLCSAVATADGGIAFATDTLSYRSQPSFDERKPDWWVVKTDALGRIRNFHDVMVDETARGSSAPFTDSPPQSLGTYETQAFAPLGGNALLVLTEPEGNLRFQASPPRILSSRTAEAVVGQHFAYHITTGFFDAGATLSYTATGLPPTGFIFNGTTGVISGVAPPGSETTTPILITLNATDGTTATLPFILSLTIGDGVPVFTVDGSDQPSTGLTDPVLAFAAKYPGALAGRVLQVEATTTPNVAASWQKLANGSSGYMTHDASTDRYVLNSTGYPLVNGLFFRARLGIFGHPEALPSNVVGPFNLASNTARAPQTLLRIKRDGLRADFDFRATLISPPTGSAVRVQRSTTPSDEGSWLDLQDGSSGQMLQEIPSDPTQRSLVFNTYPPADGIYFRALTTVSGSITSLSNVIGPFQITPDIPPSVMMTSPSGLGGTPASPIVLQADASGTAAYQVSIQATSQRPLARLQLLFDGNLASELPNAVSGTLYTVSRTTNLIGDHVLEALAVDDRGVAERAGTKPIYLRVIPAAATAAQRGETDAPATFNTSKVFTVVTSGGAWDEPTTWRDFQGNPGVPGSSDFAVIGAATVRCSSVQSVSSLSLVGGHLVGPGTLQIYGTMFITGGSCDSFIHLIIKSGAVCEMVNGSDFHLDGLLDNHGTLNVHGERGLSGLTSLLNTGQLNFQPPLLVPAVVGTNLSPKPREVQALAISLAGGSLGGGLIASGGGNVVGNDSAGLVATGGGNVVSNDSAGLVATGGGNLIAQDGGTLITNDGATLITNDGGTLVGNMGGTVKASGPGSAPMFRNEKAVPTTTGFTQSGGTLDLNSIELVGSVTIDGGVLTGSGIIKGALALNGGYISPGHSPGLIAVTGNYTQGAGGTLIVEAAGGEANESDRLQVGGSASLNGAIRVRTINGYVPLANDPFVPVGASSTSGGFSSSSANVQLTTTATGIIAVLNPAAPNPKPAQLVNISTRVRVETGDNVLIGGFIVTGTAPKRVLIRAIGPSLPVVGALADPVLELHKSDGSVITNDDWRSTQEAEITATTIPPSSNLESAIVATLAPGAHTAIMRGKNNGTGVGLVEVYDLDTAANSTLANISTRGQVQTGDNVMIGGFIIQGAEPAKVVIRAIGPSLPVAGALADPMLELTDRNGNVIGNDDWRNTQEAAVIATTVPPARNAESAIVATLVPDAYTAIVRGKNNTTGVALVEVYILP